MPSISQLPSPASVPILGHMLKLGPNKLHSQLEAWAEEFASPYRLSLPGQTLVVFHQPDSVDQTLKRRPKVFRRVQNIEAVFKELRVDGIFSAEGEDWKRQRRLVMHAFAPKLLHALMPRFQEITDHLMARWETMQEIELLDELGRFTVDITSQIVFGFDSGSVRGKEDFFHRSLANVFDMLGARFLAPFPYWRIVKFKRDRIGERALDSAREEVTKLISQARKRQEDATDADQVHLKTMLEALVAARDNENPRLRLNDEEIFANLLTIMIAGEDTTANLLTWTFYHLAKYPEVSNAVAAEVEIMRKRGLTIVPDDPFNSLPVMGSLISEMLRIRSPAPLVALAASEDTKIEGIEIPKGTAIILLTRLADRSAGRTLAEDSFVPQTVLQASHHATATSAKEIRQNRAFGGGPRICPGRGLAMLECALLLSAAVPRFRMHLLDDRAIGEQFAFVVRPSRPIQVRLEQQNMASFTPS